jgi:hypothetical protein
VRALRSPEVQARPIWPHTDEAGEKERRLGFPPSSSSRCGILGRSAEFSSSMGTERVICSLCTSRMRSVGGLRIAILCLPHSCMICLVTRRCGGNEGRASASPFSSSCRTRKRSRSKKTNPADPTHLYTTISGASSWVLFDAGWC